MVIATIIHELGHMLGAILAGIKVSEFSIGFGSTIAKLQIKEVTYKISWILLGGYVKPEKDDDEYLTYSRISRFIFTASGLIMSIFILPMLCIILLNTLQKQSVGIFSQYVTMLRYIYLHPLNYFCNGITVFPTITFPNKYLAYISCLGEISLFLGITNSIPIPVTDGGQILMNLLENAFPEFRTNSLKYRKLGYLIILVILIVPMLAIFIQNIKTTWLLLLIIGYIIYRFIKVG